MPDSEPPGQQLPGCGGQRALCAALRHPHDPQPQVTAPGFGGTFLVQESGQGSGGKRDLQGSSTRLFLGSFALFFSIAQSLFDEYPGVV